MNAASPQAAASGDASILKQYPDLLAPKYESNRARPMRLLCFGVSKTSTLSMYTALKELGLRPYHMIEAIQKPRRDFPLWEEAINAKYHYYGPLWTRREFDIVLGEFDATLDTPTNLFVEELMEAYPDAKVLLTTRDADRWTTSMRNSMGVVYSWHRSWDILERFDPWFAGPWWHFLKRVLQTYIGTDYSPDGGAKRYFNKHNAHVRAVVPKEKLLEHAPTDGWAPLCKFLDLPIPTTPYPHVNEGNSFIDLHKGVWWQAFGKAVLITATPVLVAGGVWFATARPAFKWPRGLLGN